jgi:hypothetical protein
MRTHTHTHTHTPCTADCVAGAGVGAVGEWAEEGELEARAEAVFGDAAGHQRGKREGHTREETTWVWS